MELSFEYLEISYNTVRTYERGEVKPSPYALTLISINLGISLLDILRD